MLGNNYSIINPTQICPYYENGKRACLDLVQ